MAIVSERLSRSTESGSGDDLNVVAHAIGEERAERAVDQTGGEDGLLTGPAAALYETAGNFPDRILALFIITREGKEIDAGAGFAAHRGGCHHNGIALIDPDRAAGLFRDFARFDTQSPACQFAFYGM